MVVGLACWLRGPEFFQGFRCCDLVLELVLVDYGSG